MLAYQSAMHRAALLLRLSQVGLCFSADIVRVSVRKEIHLLTRITGVLKSRRFSLGETKICKHILVRKPEEYKHLKDLVLDGSMLEYEYV